MIDYSKGGAKVTKALNIMKKFIKLFTVLLLFFTFTTNINATVLDDANNGTIDPEVILAMLEEAGYAGTSFNCEVLYNYEGNPQFSLGTSENGYIIIENETLCIHEFGSENPYAIIDSDEKYYAGPMNYYAKNNNELINIMNNNIVNEIPRAIQNLEINNEATTYQLVPGTDVGGGTTTKVANAYNYIQRKAFGYNNDNTCGAVAVQIALNYLTLQTGKNFVPTAMRSENLTSKTWTSSIYPKAHSLHRFLVEDCHMGAVRYGSILTNNFDTYVNNKVSSSYNLELIYTTILNITNIKTNINLNKPMLITTAITDGNYNFHNMVVYGYKTTSSNTMLLVHTGWYDKLVGSSTIYHPELFINPSYAVYVYRFSYN